MRAGQDQLLDETIFVHDAAGKHVGNCSHYFVNVLTRKTLPTYGNRTFSDAGVSAIVFGVM